jgi:hypothetical protein
VSPASNCNTPLAAPSRVPVGSIEGFVVILS